MSAVLLLLSFVSGLDTLFLDDFVPAGTLTNPDYFTAAIGSYLALGVIALFTVRAEGGARLHRAHRAALPVLRASSHIVPMTVGFAQFLRAQAVSAGASISDHYESPADPARRRGTTVSDDRMTVRGVPAPVLYRPRSIGRIARSASRAKATGLAAVCAYGMPDFYNRAIHL